MGKFQGFSEMALLFADKYHIIEAMQKTFEEERKHLLVDVEDLLSKKEWFSAQKDRTWRSNQDRQVSFQLCLKFEQPVLRIEIQLNQEHVKRRVAWIRLRLEDGVKNVDEIKRRIRYLAAEEVRQNFSSVEVEPLWSNKQGDVWLMQWDAPYALDNIVETICAEVERLASLFGYLETALSEAEGI